MTTPGPDSISHKKKICGFYTLVTGLISRSELVFQKDGWAQKTRLFFFSSIWQYSCCLIVLRIYVTKGGVASQDNDYNAYFNLKSCF